MGAEVEFFGNWGRVSIIFGGVKSYVGVEWKIGVRQWNLKMQLREFSRLWRETVIFNCTWEVKYAFSCMGISGNWRTVVRNLAVKVS